MSYADHPPEPIADARAQWDEAMGRLEKSVRTFAELAEPKNTATVKAERDRYEAALRRIVKDAPLIDADKMYEIARKALLA